MIEGSSNGFLNNRSKQGFILAPCKYCGTKVHFKEEISHGRVLYFYIDHKEKGDSCPLTPELVKTRGYASLSVSDLQRRWNETHDPKESEYVLEERLY